MIENNFNIQASKAIELKSIGKKYHFERAAGKDISDHSQDLWALKEVSLDVYRGEILGIVGRNGAGKTTFLNIITGVVSPTQGAIFVKGRILGLFNLGVGFQDELTGRENIFLNGALLGAAKKELNDKLKDIIEFSELGNFIDMPLGTYSQGMRLRLGFSIIASLDFDILAMDEVLAVGDTLFQNKCFQRLMDFKRINKTLVITTQSMEFIERLCDKVALLDHGHLLFYGNTQEGINKYRALLSTEKFFVGPAQENKILVENTKKWAGDRSCWGKILGTKEVVIEQVDLLNRFGWKCSKIKSGQRFKIKVYFTAKNAVKKPHFGVAIFGSNGVYCYGPNTAFEGYEIAELKQGRGFFELDYHGLLLAPGEYRISVAIWDKNETLAFNYHQGYYKLTVIGYHNIENELLNIPFRFYPRGCINLKRNYKRALDLSVLNEGENQNDKTGVITISSVKLKDHLNEEKKVFMTNEPVTLAINFGRLLNRGKNHCLWVGIYRDDNVYCQGITAGLTKNKNIGILFPKLPLLPGGYVISLGIWDNLAQDFLFYQKDAYPFRMVFDKPDHGTIYLEHSWHWR